MDEILSMIGIQHLGFDILSCNQDVRERALRAALLSGGLDLGALNGLGGRGGRDIEDLIIEDVVRRYDLSPFLCLLCVPSMKLFSSSENADQANEMQSQLHSPTYKQPRPRSPNLFGGSP